MSDKVLQAIIQLFAISAHLDGINEYEKRVIRKFLGEQVNEELVKHYMELFEDFARGVEQLQAFKVLKAINKELTQQQKVIVIANLTELTVSDGKMSKAEHQMLDTVAQAFNFQMEDFALLRDFITADDLGTLPPEHLVIIDGKEEQPANQARHIYREKMDGAVGILRIASLEMYLARYESGKSNIYLNGIALREHQAYTFSAGSTIRGEKISPIYYSDVVSLFLNRYQEYKISFEAKHLSYRFPNGKIGLRNIQIAEEGGKLIGLMGASGSGKSTLLNVLNGNLKPSRGKVLINGIDVHLQEKELRGVIGYVPQDDLLIEELTVYQNLYYAARLCFSQYNEEEIDELVLKTLQSLGISEIKDMRVGNPLQKIISGGQRKRVNIGLELLREPAVLFMDEPTSGLSSQDSENILDLLKELSLKGKLIFVVIHQPSSDIYKMFDKLMILDVDGYPIYYGNPIEAIVYFKTIANLVDKADGVCVECGNVNPEQIFSIIETKVVNEYGRFTNKRRITPRKWNEFYQNNIEIPKVQTVQEKPIKTLQAPSRFTQSLIYLTRDLLSKLSNTQYLVINLLEAPLLALVLAYILRYYHIDEFQEDIGYAFSQNVNLPAYIFISIIVALFIGLTVSAEEIIRDAKMRKREAFLHLSRNSYLAAKIAILFSFSALQTLCFVLIGNWILGIEAMHGHYWMMLFSVACFANMLGLNISATFSSVVTIYILIPLLLIPQLILGGIVVKFDEVNPHLASQNRVPWVAELMASRWAFEGLAVSQFRDNPFQKPFYEYDRRMAQAEYYKDYYCSALESVLSFCLNNLKVKNQKAKVAQEMLLLRNEFAFLQNNFEKLPFKAYEKLTVESFDFETFEAGKAYLQQVKNYHIAQYNAASDAKDAVIAQITATPEQKAQFLELRNKFQNEALSAMLRNHNDVKRVVEFQGRLVQKVYPIYQNPTPNTYWLDFQAHFFAPRKYLLGRLIDTFYFNLLAIWMMTLLLYITLYYKIFERLLTKIGVSFEKIGFFNTKEVKTPKKKL